MLRIVSGIGIWGTKEGECLIRHRDVGRVLIPSDKGHRNMGRLLMTSHYLHVDGIFTTFYGSLAENSGDSVYKCDLSPH
jgi:hypothetical protein